MFNIKGIDHVVIRTRDLATMRHFYTEVLGCPLERDRPELSFVQLRAGHALIDLIAVDGELGRKGGGPPGSDRHNMDHFCLAIEPFDEQQIRQHFTQHGVDVGPLESRYGATGEGSSIYIQDPEGNTIELKGPTS